MALKEKDKMHIYIYIAFAKQDLRRRPGKLLRGISSGLTLRASVRDAALVERNSQQDSPLLRST